MRIVRGFLKGKKLDFLKSPTTRPLRDFVKENIFNIINHSNLINIKLENANVLDLYSGVGSFGIECISQGGKKTTFIKIEEEDIDTLSVYEFFLMDALDVSDGDTSLYKQSSVFRAGSQCDNYITKTMKTKELIQLTIQHKIEASKRKIATFKNISHCDPFTEKYEKAQGVLGIGSACKGILENFNGRLLVVQGKFSGKQTTEVDVVYDESLVSIANFKGKKIDELYYGKLSVSDGGEYIGSFTKSEDDVFSVYNGSYNVKQSLATKALGTFYKGFLKITGADSDEDEVVQTIWWEGKQLTEVKELNDDNKEKIKQDISEAEKSLELVKEASKMEFKGEDSNGIPGKYDFMLVRKETYTSENQSNEAKTFSMLAKLRQEIESTHYDDEEYITCVNQIVKYSEDMGTTLIEPLLWATPLLMSKWGGGSPIEPLVVDILGHVITDHNLEQEQRNKYVLEELKNKCKDYPVRFGIMTGIPGDKKFNGMSIKNGSPVSYWINGQEIVDEVTLREEMRVREYARAAIKYYYKKVSLLLEEEQNWLSVKEEIANREASALYLYAYMMFAVAEKCTSAPVDALQYMPKDMVGFPLKKIDIPASLVHNYIEIGEELDATNIAAQFSDGGGQFEGNADGSWTVVEGGVAYMEGQSVKLNDAHFFIVLPEMLDNGP